MSSLFKDRVIEIVRAIPYGKVVSYGQVALYAGIPRAARQVGWILNQTEGKISLPWWRVINKKGLITIKGAVFSDRELQRKLLKAEGIEVSDDFLVDMNKYRFIADKLFIKEMKLDKNYLSALIEKGLLL